MLITGCFRDYPLPLLLEIFLHKNETGLLEIVSPSESGHIYIKDGKLVDATLGKLEGNEAVTFADTLTDSTFRFNSLPPAEYARFVWQTSLESRSNGLPDLRSRALAVYSVIRQFHEYATMASRSLEEALRSRVKSRLAQATAAFARQNEAMRMRLTLLQRLIADWQTGRRAQQNQISNERISSLVSFMQPERLLALSRNTQLLSLLKQEPVLRNSFAVIAVAVLGATLVIGARQAELRRNQSQTSTAGNDSGESGAESQVQSKPVFSNAAGLARNLSVTGPGVNRKGNANEKGNLQRSTGKIRRENSTVSNITKETSSLRQKKTSASPQPPANLADDSAGSKAQAAPTRAVQTISVVLQVEDGRVSQASLKERRPGMEGYEAAALRIARQRRYPAGAKRTDIVVVKVDNSHSN